MLCYRGEDGHAVTAVLPIGTFSPLDEPEFSEVVLGHAVCGFGDGNLIARGHTVRQACRNKVLADIASCERVSNSKQEEMQVLPRTEVSSVALLRVELTKEVEYRVELLGHLVDAGWR